jgi:predicted ATPase/class 3 adenylate cyclase
MPQLPTGNVTFLFTDIEGSTRLLGQHPNEYAGALLRHDALLRHAVDERDGVIFETVGDAVYAAFANAADALSAALDAQLALAAEDWGHLGRMRVRMALHRGQVELRTTHYFGAPLYRCARLMAIGYGGQTLLSAATAEAVRGALPDGASLRAMGSHRLKDLAEPENVFQLAHRGLPTDFPPLKSLSKRAVNIPTQPTSFVGRAHEREEIGRLLEGSRLLTLTGPGGTGKTRLAVQVATDQLAAFDDGVCFVSLATLRQSALLAGAIAQALEVNEDPPEPIAVTVAKYLRDKEFLLILDNFEQIAAGASLVSDLLASCLKLKIFATSRIPLRVAAEKRYAVPPLGSSSASTSPSRLPRPDAVVLFLQRAFAVKHDFAVTDASLAAIAEICDRLEGLPLSIELAAARCNVLSPHSMIALLQRRLPLLSHGAVDLPPRQQSVSAAIEWSYELLDREGQANFRKVAVFVGGCSIDAAATVREDTDSITTYEALSGLVDHSLLRQEIQPDGSPRFVMLETIREYGVDRLTEARELDRCRLHHAEHFAALAESALRAARTPETSGPPENEWLDRLQADHDNLRAAFDWAISDGRHEIAVKVATSLTFFWIHRGYVTEGRDRMQALLDAGAALSDASRASVLYCAGQLAWAQGDYVKAVAFYEESVSLMKKTGDVPGQIRSLAALATARVQQGQFETATAIAAESLAMARQAGDWGSIGVSLGVLATAALERDDYRTAEAIWSEGLAIVRRHKDRRSVAPTLINLGWVLILASNFDRATDVLNEGLRVAEEIDDRRATGFVRIYLGLLALYRGDHATAAQLLHRSLSLARDIGDKQAIAESTSVLGALRAAQGHATEAARLWGGAEGMYRRMGAEMGRAERTVQDKYVATVRAELGDETFASAWSAGARMSMDQLIQEALSISAGGLAHA